MHIGVYLPVCNAHAVPMGGQKRAPDPQELELQAIVSPSVGPGNPTSFSTRAESASNQSPSHLPIPSLKCVFIHLFIW